MSPTRAHQLTLFFAALGIALSGYLTYLTYFAEGCREFFITCGGATPVKIFGLPTCVYGLVMFTLLAILAISGMAKKSAGILTATFTIGIIGTLFAASLSVYELWIRDVPISGLPACVYGFFLYLGILIVTSLAQRNRAVTV